MASISSLQTLRNPPHSNKRSTTSIIHLPSPLLSSPFSTLIRHIPHQHHSKFPLFILTTKPLEIEIHPPQSRNTKAIRITALDKAKSKIAKIRQKGTKLNPNTSEQRKCRTKETTEKDPKLVHQQSRITAITNNKRYNRSR